MARRRRRTELLGLVPILALAGFGACDAPAPAPPGATLSVADAMGGEAAAGFARATEVRAFEFPRDHGAHPAFRTEWWYATGNLETATGRRLGYQLTIFRSAMAPPGTEPAPAERASAWAADQAYLGHFAVSLGPADGGAEGAFVSDSREARGALGLAGVRSPGAEGAGGALRVWVGDWSIEEEAAADPDRPGPAVTPGAPGAPGTAAALGPLRLRAATAAGDDAPSPAAAIDLRLEPIRPPVLQGDRGLSQKGRGEGNASYYYSLTRLATTGTLRVGDETFAVRGLSWLDREWSTSALDPDQEGWDWFSLQLADGRDLMLYRLRGREAGADSLSGTLVEPAAGDGIASRPLRLDGLTLEPLARWRSPRSGASYPVRWRLALPAEGLDLELAPLLDDQELDVGFRYWEGAVAVTGTSAGAPVSGRGYVELTGYAEDLTRSGSGRASP